MPVSSALASFAEPRLSIDLDAVRANHRFFAGRAPGAETAAVVKADAYGCGLGPVARTLLAERVRTFFVATPYEGAQLREVLGPPADGCRVYALNGFCPGEARDLAACGVAPVINTLEQAREWAALDGVPPAPALQIDTGLNRLGLPADQALAIANDTDLMTRLKPDLVMSHLACGFDPDHPMNRRQREAFSGLCGLFPQARASLAASAGVLLGPDYHFDLTRVGVGLYGGARQTDDTPALAPVVRLEAPILQIRDLEPGDRVGYGADFAAQSPMRAAVLSVGYADGVLRALGGKGYAAFGSHQLPVLGRVSMDLLTIDVTAAGADAAPGAFVTVLGGPIDLDDQARHAGTIGYELLVRLGPRLRREWRGGAAQ
ncbi:MAG: alanine racemase [Maricaulaceae bacterium]